MPLNNLPFHLPCAIKRKGTPKLPKRSSKKRKLETNVLSERNASRWMALGIDETLVDSVMKGLVLVDNCALRDVDDIDNSIVDCDEDQLQVYFTNDGWLNFLNIILTKQTENMRLVILVKSLHQTNQKCMDLCYSGAKVHGFGLFWCNAPV